MIKNLLLIVIVSLIGSVIASQELPTDPQALIGEWKSRFTSIQMWDVRAASDTPVPAASDVIVAENERMTFRPDGTVLMTAPDGRPIPENWRWSLAHGGVDGSYLQLAVETPDGGRVSINMSAILDNDTLTLVSFVSGDGVPRTTVAVYDRVN